MNCSYKLLRVCHVSPRPYLHPILTVIHPIHLFPLVMFHLSYLPHYSSLSLVTLFTLFPYHPISPLCIVLLVIFHPINLTLVIFQLIYPTLVISPHPFLLSPFLSLTLPISHPVLSPSSGLL